MTEILNAKKYIKEELFKDIKIKDLAIKYAQNSLTLFFIPYFFLSIISLICTDYEKLEFFTMIFAYCVISSTSIVTLLSYYSIKNKKHNELPLDFLFKNKIMSLKEQEHYFQIVKSLNIQSSCISLLISKKMKELDPLPFGNKLVMLLSLEDAINKIEEEENATQCEDVIKTFL